MKKPLLIRPAVIALIIAAVLVRYPCIKDVNIISIEKHRQIWIVTGTMTVNPQEVPEELRYNREGCLPWWEQHINEVLDMHKIPLTVVKLELWFESTSESADVIGFYAECKVGRARVFR